MRFIHITDTHLTPVGTRHRTDNFEDAIFAKLEYVACRAEELGIGLIIHTGDVFDLRGTRGVPRELVVRFGDFLSSHQPLHWLLLAGQHDYRGRDPSAARYAPLSLLKWHPNATVVVDRTVDSLSFDDFSVTAVPFHEGIMETLPSLRAGNVLAAHAMVVDQEVQFEHVLQDELLSTGAQVIVTGDYHRGYPVRRVETITALLGEAAPTFSNPGALARTTISDADRMPQMAVICDGDVVYEPVPASPNAFDLSASAVVAEERRSAFAERLSKLNFTTELSWDALVEGLEEEEDADVIAAARTYYEAALPT